MEFERNLAIFFLAVACCVSIGCDDMQMLDVMDGGPVLPDGYLSLSSEDEDAITPTNDSSQWSYFEDIWEKVKGGEVPENTAYPVDWNVDAFKYWIYLHARSRIVFDFRDRHYSKFECSVLLPNFCNGTASIEMKWLANNVEVYNSGVINSEEIVGIAFDIPPHTKILTLEVSDAGDGITCDHFIIGDSRLMQTPPELLPSQPDLMLSEAYLSLSSQDMDAMTAINDSQEWVGSGEIWEKIKGQETPPMPDGTVDWNTETFEHWFYSHAESRIVFDLKGQNFTYFECDSRLPNTCGDVASVEFIWFADDVEVYNSGVIKSPLETEMAFDIPAGAKTLTLQVTDGGDTNGCDHFIIGNPRLYAEKSEEAVRREMYRALPEISMTAELEPGKYIISANHVDRGNYKIRGLYKTIGDSKTNEAEVRIELSRQPWDTTADGDSVIDAVWTGSEWLHDEIVVEIIRKIEVRDEPKGRFTKTIHIYEGIALLNLTQSQNLFEYEEAAAEPHLWLPSESGDSIKPINDKSRWSGWNDYIWGTIKDGVAPPIRDGFAAHPTIDTFEQWFYSHAPSRIVYDISGHDFGYFDCSVLLANLGCGGAAKIEVFWFADNIEVYNSGIILAGDIVEVGFEIPAGTQRLTLDVTDGGNGNGCDGFVIGNPMLYLTKPATQPHVSITPTEIRNPPVGSQFTVNINIAEGKDVTSYNLNVNFDSTALKYVSSANGGFLRNALVLPTVSGGSIQLIGALLSGASHGNGTLVTVTFEVLVAKSSDITLTDVSITNTLGKRLEATTAGAKVVVQ